MKRFGFAVIFLTVFGLGMFYWVYGQGSAELVSTKSEEVRKDDFIMYIRVEDMKEGFQVFRSVQYIGEEPVEMKHQTPLVSVSFQHKNHDYTGSTVTKKLCNGNSYHPQEPKVFKAPEKGEYSLFSEAKFTVNGKKIKIKNEEKILFN